MGSDSYESCQGQYSPVSKALLDEREMKEIFARKEEERIRQHMEKMSRAVKGKVDQVMEEVHYPRDLERLSEVNWAVKSTVELIGDMLNIDNNCYPPDNETCFEVLTIHHKLALETDLLQRTHSKALTILNYLKEVLGEIKI